MAAVQAICPDSTQEKLVYLCKNHSIAIMAFCWKIFQQLHEITNDILSKASNTYWHYSSQVHTFASSTTPPLWSQWDLFHRSCSGKKNLFYLW